MKPWLHRTFSAQPSIIARKIIDAVKPKLAKFCYEMMGWALPDSADSYLKMLKAVERDAFGVHMDPCNAINSPSRYQESRKFLFEQGKQIGIGFI